MARQAFEDGGGSRAWSRARFLALLAGGAGVLWLGTRAVGAVGGWRLNTVERPRPTFDLNSYRLVIDGLVERPLTLTYDELRALPSVRQVSDFRCVEGWGVDDVQWDGVRFQSMIDMVRPAPEAGYVTFHSLGDVYRDSLTLEQAMLPDVLVAYDMDRAPLPPDHGLPLRLVMPRMFGYKGPKWVTRIEFRDQRDIGYWETRGWRVDAWIEA
jgi:DMSO/TMAO reductase YedYZ molybdopterin-dependent catalytic subunit